MESYRLKSKVAVDNKEYLVQTVNDAAEYAVVSSLFVDGKVLEVSRHPHQKNLNDDDILSRVKSTHQEKKEELESLIATYRQVSQSGDVDLMFHLGVAFYFKHMYEEACALFQSVLVIKEDYHQANNYLGLTYLCQNRGEDAVRELARAVKLRPQFADYHNNYGEALLETGNCRRAVEQFEAALKINIYYADAYLNLGIAYIANAVSREDYEMFSSLKKKTREYFDKAIMIDPTIKSPSFEEAHTILKADDYDRSLRLFKAVRDMHRDENSRRFSSFYLRFHLFSDRANERLIDERINYLINEIDKNPTFVDLHYELGLCYLQQARFYWQQGIEKFEEAASINRKLPKARVARDKAEDLVPAMRAVVSEIAKEGQG